jgi:tRNA-specific 2-thiouridylase
VEAVSGAVVDEDGNELGRHDGYWRFTPGQRRGLGIAAPEPLYALRTDAATNTVVAGPRAALACRELDVEGVLHRPVERVEAKVRYRSPAVAAQVAPRPGGYRLRLEEAAYAVAPGQVVALYEDDAVVGSGVVSCVGRN